MTFAYRGTPHAFRLSGTKNSASYMRSVAAQGFKPARISSLIDMGTGTIAAFVVHLELEYSLMRALIFSWLLMLVHVTAGAAEAGIGGRASDRTHFSFDFGIGEIPASGDYYIPPGFDSANPGSWQTIPLRANLLRPVSTGETEVLESQCVYLQSAAHDYISCAASPKNELSGLVYKSVRIDKNGERHFICIKNCTKRAPRKLQTFTVESGC